MQRVRLWVLIKTDGAYDSHGQQEFPVRVSAIFPVVIADTYRL